jgi:uncharacterized RDD family membrane protein YckC
MSSYGSTPPPPPPPPPPAGGFEQQSYGTAAPVAPFASWIQRVGAYIVDYLVYLVPFGILSFVFQPKATTATVNGQTTTTSSGGNLVLALVFGLLALAVVIYNRWILGGRGQSLGKRALNLRLLGEQTGQPVGTLMAFVRDIAHLVDGLICFVGYLFPLWDSRRQTLADKIVKTVVVKA